MNKNMMDQMTWIEYEASTKEKILILPVGSTEQHGPHLPLGVDTIIVTIIASAIAAQIPAVIAPTLSYGVNLSRRVEAVHCFREQSI